MSLNKRVAVIIPAYNEAGRLDKAFSEIRRFRSTHPALDLEIVFVNDGSRDDTAGIISAFARAEAGVRLLSYPRNRGKGYAVRCGIINTDADYYLVADADMSTSLQELDRFLPGMAQGEPVIIGTRKEHGAVLIKKQPWYRQKMGEAYAVCARRITGLKIKDFGCGFKVFSRAAARAIFPAAIIDRWVWDTEILFLAKQRGYHITEIGINWTNDEDTRVGIVKESFCSLLDLLRIYRRHK